MNKQVIESEARDLQIKIWNKRKEFWPNREPSLFEIPDPELAASILDVGFEYREDLGRFGFRGSHFEVAGQLDRNNRTIAVSRKFSPEVIRFTGAHEIGHWMLHLGESMHRDRPIKGLQYQPSIRPPYEMEADYFAACFLMPRKLVERAFELSFSTKRFVFNDANAFHLSPSDPGSLLWPRENSLDRELSLATAEFYGGLRFSSLAKRFRVSASTMAIRLSELGLIQSP